MLPFEGGATGTLNGTLIFAFLLAISYLFYGQRRISAMKVVAKTGSILLLAVLAFLAGGPWLLVLALMLCAAGDFFLAIEDRGEVFFLCGLAAFLAGHCAYIALFLAIPETGAPIPLPIAAALAAAMATAAAIMATLLWNAVGPLRAPVMVYLVVILVMALAALGQGSVTIIVGAALFMLSDSILAAERFLLRNDAPGRQFAGPSVWITYFAAQVLITLGVLAG
jgi:uncharacterized membrane protein YhhN